MVAALPDDQLNTTGQNLFTTLRNLLNVDITDGNGNVLHPVVISSNKSQVRLNPTLVICAQLDPDEDTQLIDTILGSMKRRKEKVSGAVV